MEDIAIEINNVSKVYKLYDKPIDRLKETISLTKKSYHKDFYALNSINLKIKKGETVGIIGKNGAMLKKIGSAARKEIINILGTKVYLEVWVKVKEDWRNSSVALKSLGYDTDNF